MGLKRLSLLVVFAAVVVLGVAPSASAGNFDETRMGCTGEDPATCATATTGTPYRLEVRLQGDEDTGCAVLSVTSGMLPPGLSITQQFNETKYAVISGTPTQAGDFGFYLNVNYYGQGCAKPDSQDRFIIPVKEGLAKLIIGPESTTPGTVSAPYSLQMTATVAEPKTWSINAGALPPGLSINSETGLISGTPTASGQFDFQVLAKMNSDSRSDTKALGIVIRDPLAITSSDPFTEARRAAGEVSAPFEAALVASGGTGTYVWTLSSGVLPDGLTMVNGAISGTPTAAGVYRFTATVTDSEGRVANYPGRIVVVEELEVSTLFLRPGRVGRLYEARVRTTGGLAPTTWRIVRGPLPRGVRFDRTTGKLSGIPKKAGSYRVTFEATDGLGVTATKRFRIVIAPAPVPKPKPKK